MLSSTDALSYMVQSLTFSKSSQQGDKVLKDETSIHWYHSDSLVHVRNCMICIDLRDILYKRFL